MAKKSKLPVLVFSKGGRNSTEVRCELSEFKGKMMLNMREWYLDSDDDEMKPGRGFTVPHAKAVSFLEELQEWANDMLEAMPEVDDDDDDRPAKKAKKSDKKTSKKRRDDDEDEDDDDRPRKKAGKKKRSKDADEELEDLEDDDEDDDEPVHVGRKKNKKKSKR